MDHVQPYKAVGNSKNVLETFHCVLHVCAFTQRRERARSRPAARSFTHPESAWDATRRTHGRGRHTHTCAFVRSFPLRFPEACVAP